MPFFRVFYFVDIKEPKKFEVILHSQDTVHPPHYLLTFLPACLTPTFDNSVLQQGGRYALSNKKEAVIGIYFFQFKHTTGACSATEQNLEIRKISDVKGDVNKFLPPRECTFQAYQKPQSFYSSYEVDIQVKLTWKEGKKEGKKEGIIEERKRIISKLHNDPVLMQKLGISEEEEEQEEEEQEEEQEGMDVDRCSMRALPGNEYIHNQNFVLWLRSQLDKTMNNGDFVLHDNEMSKHSYSRYSRSKEDFGFYFIPKQNTSCLEGASVSLDRDETYSELTGSSGDCKMDAKDSDKNQLIANMTKTASDIAVNAGENGILFHKITIYGTLVNYASVSAVKIYMLELYFDGKKTHLTRCDGLSLSAEHALERIVTKLNHEYAVVARQ